MKWKLLLSICLILMLTLSVGLAIDRNTGLSLGNSDDGDSREEALAGNVASDEETETTTFTVAGTRYQSAEEEVETDDGNTLIVGVIEIEEEDETSFIGVPSTDYASCGSHSDCAATAACYKPDNMNNMCIPCYDSDNGFDAYTAGVSQGVNSYYDFAYYGTDYAADTCLENGQLQEWSCSSDGSNTYLALTYKDCPWGCADGACLTIEAIDGGVIGFTECDDLIDNDPEYVEAHSYAGVTEDENGNTIDGIDAYGVCVIDGERQRCTSLSTFDESSSTNIATLRSACGKACIMAGGDYIKYDPQCAYPSRDQEINVCSDGRDNDEDGLTDYPNDPGCQNYGDDAEQDEPLEYVEVPIGDGEETSAPIYENIVEDVFGSVLDTRTCDSHSDCGSTAACGNTGYCIECRESDGGSNVYTQGFYQGVFYFEGTTISGDQALGDVCGSNGLVEFYCQEFNTNTFLTSKVYECEGDCADGACELGLAMGDSVFDTGEEESQTFDSKRELGQFLGSAEEETVRVEIDPSKGLTLGDALDYADDSDNDMEIAGINYPGLAAAFENLGSEETTESYTCSDNYDCVEAGKGLVCEENICVNMCKWKLIECTNGEDDDGDGDIDYFGGCDTDNDGKSEAICGCFVHDVETDSMELVSASNGGICASVYTFGCVDLESGDFSNQQCQGDYYPADGTCTSPLYVYEGGLDNGGNALKTEIAGTKGTSGLGLQRAAGVSAAKWYNPMSWF